MKRRFFVVGVLAGLVCTMGASCLDTAASLFSGLFPRVVTVVVENDTPFAARPRLSVSGSDNLLEDVFSEQRGLPGANEQAVPANQTRTFTVPCDGSSQTILVRGAKFEAFSGFGVGDVNLNRRLRHGTDFECGDTIRLRLSGNIFSFNAQATVEQRATSPSSVFTSPTSPTRDNRDIGTILDELFD